MDNLLKATLKSQTIPSGALFVISLIAWPIVVDILRDFQGKDRLQFNCVPKLNEVTRQLCYDRYNSALSPRLTPLDFAGITFGLSSFGWLIVTLVNHWLLRRIRDKKISKANRKKNVDHYYWVFIGHICYQLALLTVMMGLFCCYQKLEYPAEYRCFSANTTLTVFNQVAVNFTCNDIRYNEKSKVNIVIIVVFSLSIVFSLAAMIQLKLQGKEKILEHLLRNLEEDEGEENASLGELLCYHLYIRILQVLSDSHSLKNFLGTGTWQINQPEIFSWSMMYSFLVDLPIFIYYSGIFKCFRE